MFTHHTGNRVVHKLFTMTQTELDKIMAKNRRELKIAQNKVLWMEAEAKHERRKEENAAKWLEYDKVQHIKNPNGGKDKFLVQPKPQTAEEVEVYREYRESAKKAYNKQRYSELKQQRANKKLK